MPTPQPPARTLRNGLSVSAGRKGPSRGRWNRTLRVVGLMSGTSADGIDAALVRVPPQRRPTLLAFATFPYPPKLREAVLALCRPETARIDDLCHLNFALGEALADAVLRLARAADVPLAAIDLVGSHGQTVWHDPLGRRAGRRRVRSTLQIGEPCVIAERTGIWTVGDFRPRDVAAGGEGAPLVPWADWRLFADPRRSRALQNVGGIANVTYLPAGRGPEAVLAFDTGPGNMVIDRLTARATAGRQAFDAGGRLAARGTVREGLLAELLDDAFFRRRPPKSTGRERFGWDYADALWRKARRGRTRTEDLLATATALTAASIADAYRRFLPGGVDEAIVSGGGARNDTLMRMLAERLAPAKVLPSDAAGLDADAKEAVAFALLAAATVRGQCANVPSATGAGHRAVLGKIIPGRR